MSTGSPILDLLNDLLKGCGVEDRKIELFGILRDIAREMAEGNVGAGTGATVGKLLGPKFATKSGLGTASLKIGRGIIVGAIVAVNAFGDVVDPRTGVIIAGTRKPVVGGFVDTVRRMQGDLGQTLLGFAANTTLAVVATNAYLTKEAANKVAQMAHDGLARTIRPVHTMFDGDTIFALATGEPPKKGPGADPSVVGTAAAEVLARAVVRAVEQAEALGGLPAARDLRSANARPGRVSKQRKEVMGAE